jgi:predicted ATP pyrophosphatase (TIGR00289 family)
MKVAVLFSGGKDSTYAAYLSKKHEIKYLATIHSKNPDSFMYHTPNIGLTVIQAAEMGLQLISKESEGEKEKEVHDLKILLDGLGIEGVVCGAVESKYQRSRIEKVCKELKLKLIAPLWKKDPEKLLRAMIKNKFEIIITAVAADGFDESWLGRRIDERCIEDLKKLNKEKGIHISGEGGEFETIVLYCPMFKKRIQIVESEKMWKENYGVLEIRDVKLI